VIRWYRQREGLTQQDAAELLNTTQSRLSKLEKGSQALRDVDELRFIASKLSIPPERLGILPDHSADSVPQPRTVSSAPGTPRDSQERWKFVRAQMNQNRALLGDLAGDLYPVTRRVSNTTVLTCPEWMPDGPVELSKVQLHWLPEDTAPPPITGGLPETEGVRPLTAQGTHYNRYSRALRDLARPRLLDNRISYRLREVSWENGTGSLGFSYTSYFDVLDVCEALSHEFTSAWLDNGRKGPGMSKLRLRRRIVDPFALFARPMLPSINTLTIRRDSIDGHRMYLHKRDAAATAVAGGMYHVVPAGVFQPSSIAPAHQANDFSLWRNIQREFSEELLGNPEHDGNAIDPIEYEHEEPFRSFEQARKDGDFRTFVLATVLEPLTLWAEFLTVSVIEAPVFDKLFADMVEVNEEGSSVSTEQGRPAVGIPFTSDTRERLRSEPLSPISRATIELAWQNRHLLLG
jgi:transcriptional regulator with XRE-family HTH domain